MEPFLHALNWFEIPVSDFQRAKKFYSTVFNYEMPEVNMGPVTMGILLHNRDAQGIGGAIVHGEGYIPSKTGSKVYLNAGHNMAELLLRIEPAGGKLVVDRMSIGDMGFVAIMEDSEGNQVSLHAYN
jgi:predicted enzyme related to lactoylglutathione lyase